MISELFSRWSRIAALIACALPLAAVAHEHEAKTPEPGYRHYSEFAPAFIDALPAATIEVYPTIIRRVERTAHSFESRSNIVSTLKDRGVAHAVAAPTRIDLGELQYASQWNIFQDDLAAITQRLENRKTDADYRMVMEIVAVPNNQAVFGIHWIILDAQGNNAFSFLLNSHHQIFAEANLMAADSSESARSAMIARATQAGLRALLAQIDSARVCATHTPINAIVVGPGLVDAFEGILPTGKDASGNLLGFQALHDEQSDVTFMPTRDHPELPPKFDNNTVLKLDMNIAGWGAIAHFFENPQVDQWITYDWSQLEQIDFWLYGNDSGTKLFFHVLDNRTPCSSKDDAERFGYEFTDDFSGWERVTIPLDKLTRVEVWNGAPDDGLGLTTVHGWAFGALNTDGPITFYIDDVSLGMKPMGHTGFAINEIPMFGGQEKTAAQKKADRDYIKFMTKDGRSRSDGAESAAKTGWNNYYKGNKLVAIKRFNQAWLLDPDNQLALWGFAAISGDRGEIEEAVRYFEKAIENGPENPSLRRDYEITLKQLAKREN